MIRCELFGHRWPLSGAIFVREVTIVDALRVPVRREHSFTAFCARCGVPLSKRVRV